MKKYRRLSPHIFALIFSFNLSAAEDNPKPISPEDSLRFAHAQDSTRALLYAPILWFASSEEYFPTIPFYTAFNWSPARTLAAELQPEMIRPERSWRGLMQAYDADTLARRQVWVFWDKDKRGISKNEFQTLLGSDRQFHRREQEYLLRIESEVDSIEVFRYWMYYLYDTGLEGHPQDIEFVYVFVPVWKKDMPRDKKFARTPLALVGAGHTEMVPNNVLLCNTPLDTIVILTELGGHASAPDRNNDGNLNPGYDANWQAANLWGTRDTQASSGLGAFGNYQSWMTFPRKPEFRCYPPKEEYKTKPGERRKEKWLYRLERVEDLKRLYDGIWALRTRQQIRTKEDSTLWRRMGGHYEKLGGPSQESWLALDHGWRTELYQRLLDWHKDQWTYKRNEQTGDLEQTGHNKLVAAKHMPWRHSYYRGRANKIFKRHIFPPTGNRAHWLRGAYLRYAGKRETSAGLILHVTEPPGIRDLFKLPGVVVLEAGYRWVANDSTNVDDMIFTGRDQLAARLLYDVTYNTLFTGYFGWGLETDRLRSDMNHTRKFLYGGIKAEYHLEGLPGSFNFLQVRFGVRIPNNGHHLRANRSVLDLQVSLHR